MLLLRAVVAAPSGDAPAPGLVAVEAGRVAGWSGFGDADPGRGEVELLEHHRVIEAIAARVACLPARFGSVFADPDALFELLRTRERQLLERLERVGRRHELAVTLAWLDRADWSHSSGDAPRVEPSRAGAPFSGRAYLESKGARARDDDRQQARAKQLADRLTEQLAVEPAFVRHETCPRTGVAVSMSLLLELSDIARVRSRIEGIGAELPDVRTIVYGPWPPYTFATLE